MMIPCSWSKMNSGKKNQRPGRIIWDTGSAFMLLSPTTFSEPLWSGDPGAPLTPPLIQLTLISSTVHQASLSLLHLPQLTPDSQATVGSLLYPVSIVPPASLLLLAPSVLPPRLWSPQGQVLCRTYLWSRWHQQSARLIFVRMSAWRNKGKMIRFFEIAGAFFVFVLFCFASQIILLESTTCDLSWKVTRMIKKFRVKRDKIMKLFKEWILVQYQWLFCLSVCWAIHPSIHPSSIYLEGGFKFQTQKK